MVGKGFFGGFFDWNGNGKIDGSELAVGLAMLDDAEREQKKEEEKQADHDEN